MIKYSHRIIMGWAYGQATKLSGDMIPLVAEEPTVSIADVATQLDVPDALKAESLSVRRQGNRCNDSNDQGALQ